MPTLGNMLVPLHNDPLNAMLDDLGAMIGQDCAFDSNGVVTFEINGRQVSLEACSGDETVAFHTPIGRLPEFSAGRSPNDPADVMRAALVFNLFRQPLAGSWLALEDDSEELLLCLSAAKGDLRAEGLADILTGLAEAADRTRAALVAAGRSIDDAIPETYIRV